ncbi:hypothetical protein FCH28_17405 [Streptomyces piniterrae]|uniref:Uncharacterized protein n=1 Tax=Streptomyces piniterrae TaxID=2571125 RepID=A0A4V5MKG5_9ACTN|nr:hypothetical protein FCH28_17405 [Streptomyces piniterrae]
MLPANGEPWVPDQQAAPPAGQPWGQPWGPGQQDAQPYGQPPAQGQLPPQGQPPAQPQAYGQGNGQGYGQAPFQQAPDPMAQPLPPQGQPAMPPMPPAAPAAMPPQPTSLEKPAAAAPSGALPPEGRPYGGQPQQPYTQQAQQPQSYDQPAPPQPQQYGQQPQAPSGQLVPATPQAGAPLPPAAGDADKTALIRPIGAQGTPGAAPLPPEKPETPGESTQLLRRVQPAQGGAPGQGRPLPQAQPMPAAGADSEATQLIPPVGTGVPGPPPGAPYGVRPGAPGDRPTPAEFEGLFRDGPGASGAAAPDSTAQLPRFEDPGRPPYGQQFPQQGGGHGGYETPSSYDDDDRGGRRRGLAPAAIIGIIVVVLAGAGLGVGWALSGAGDDSAKKETPGSGTEKTAKQKPAPEPSADPAEGQAKELDALLGDSNNSRASVISAVNSIKTCDNLGGAAKDLRAAAAQRNELVTRLKQLQVDKIPNNAQLTAALTKAWQSSASADNHYAAWAGQVAGKKGCPKGKARVTGQTAQGNAASGEATRAKQQAAKTWNPIARKYGLTERRPEQL